MDGINIRVYRYEMPLGINIRYIRQAKDLSHDALGALASTDERPVSGQAISMLESRKSGRSIHASAIARALGVPIDDLLRLDLTSVDEARVYLESLAPRHATDAIALASRRPAKWPFPADISPDEIAALPEGAHGEIVGFIRHVLGQHRKSPSAGNGSA